MLIQLNYQYIKNQTSLYIFLNIGTKKRYLFFWRITHNQKRQQQSKMAFVNLQMTL